MNRMLKILKINNIDVFILILIAFTVCNGVLSQSNNLGFPSVVNYSKEEYGAGTQNWDAAYLKSGNILFANNDGLISFNGSEWQLLKTPGQRILRSLEVCDNENQIWVGGQDEIGYFSKIDGKYEYVDVKQLIPKEHRSLDDVWEIVEESGKIYFRSRNKIFVFQENAIEVIFAKTSITFLQSFNGQVYYNEWYEGLFTIENGKPVFVEGSDVLTEMAIIDIIGIDNEEAIILTGENGLFKLRNDQIEKWETNCDDYLSNYGIVSGHFLSRQKKIILGSERGGVLIINDQGQVEISLNKKSGLQNNPISAITEDGKGNIWLGTYNGIDRVNLYNSNPVFYPDGELEGTLFDILEWKGHYYFGSNNGLFRLEKRSYYNPLLKSSFEEIKECSGQVWGMDILDNRLLVGHNQGIFEVDEDGSAVHVSDLIGAWRFEKLNRELMVAGTYAGLDLYRLISGKWTFEKRYGGFSESSRIIYLDKKQNLWVSHPYKGLFKINFSENYQEIMVDTIGSKDGISDFENCYVHEIDDVIFVSNKHSIYKYDYGEKMFFEDKKFNSYFSGQVFKRFFDSPYGLWYITNKEAGIIDLEQSGLDINLSKKTFLHGEVPFVGGFENLFPIGEHEALLCTDKGVVHRSFNDDAKEDVSVKLISILISDGLKDSLVYNGQDRGEGNLAFEYKYNNLRLNFVSNYLEGKAKNVNYSYRLKGYEDHWSDWNSMRFKEYTNLNNGEYVFEIRGSKHNDENSPVSKFQFEIKPPWYKTLFMKILYFVLACLVVLSLVMVPNRKIKKEKDLILNQKIETEAKVENLESEKLQNEIKYQNKELANLTMHLLQKSETIKQIQTEVENVRKKIKDPDARKEIKKVVSLINSDNRLEEDWNNFSYHFDKVHHEFLKRIKEEFTKLSPNDLKLCAYLRLNLSTKEIAPLLNISTRGVEISRYRLRKKLGLTSDINLNSFMMSY